MIEINLSQVLGQAQNWYLDFLIDPSFPEVNILFVLSFEYEALKRRPKRYFLPTVQISDYNILIDGQLFLIKLLQMI